jgi:hypothetical protein
MWFGIVHSQSGGSAAASGAARPARTRTSRSLRSTALHLTIRQQPTVRRRREDATPRPHCAIMMPANSKPHATQRTPRARQGSRPEAPALPRLGRRRPDRLRRRARALPSRHERDADVRAGSTFSSEGRAWDHRHRVRRLGGHRPGGPLTRNGLRRLPRPRAGAGRNGQTGLRGGRPELGLLRLPELRLLLRDRVLDDLRFHDEPGALTWLARTL